MPKCKIAKLQNCKIANNTEVQNMHNCKIAKYDTLYKLQKLQNCKIAKLQKMQNPILQKSYFKGGPTTFFLRLLLKGGQQKNQRLILKGS